ncbi:MAG: hypothetical protein ACTHU0_22855 [Kofleriaceae bacterium]
MVLRLLVALSIALLLAAPVDARVERELVDGEVASLSLADDELVCQLVPPVGVPPGSVRILRSGEVRVPSDPSLARVFRPPRSSVPSRL